MNMPQNKPLLLLIDLQKAIDHPDWGERNNIDAEENIATLLAHWRNNDLPIIHVKHTSVEPNSHYRPHQEGNDFKAVAQPETHEEVIEKHTNSAFINTPLEQILRERNIQDIVIIGVITNNSVEATARMSGNLGFNTTVVSDATFTFGKKDYSGKWHNAQQIHDISLSNMAGEYAQIISTKELLSSID
ncbi:cysteine hydrolase family protein [uncultured Cocleimonas sp.]|uniref:cysteine hydrolase family protein n=1 Tax=uncultured Cocleimonas sp. TaxID=1051587 RepID=UPI00261A4D9E|nr:cysteine hydrolase family protein [uncultured Cocleimonas sp.]